MKRSVLYIIVLIGLFIFSSCKKEIAEPVKALVFQSLSSSSNNISTDTDVNIVANVEGLGVQYYWSYNSGTISGSGNSIYYQNSMSGYFKVLCTVIDSSGELDSKEIYITVQ